MSTISLLVRQCKPRTLRSSHCLPARPARPTVLLVCAGQASHLCPFRAVSGHIWETHGSAAGATVGYGRHGASDEPKPAKDRQRAHAAAPSSPSSSDPIHHARAVVVTRSPPPAASASESSGGAQRRAREGEHAAYAYLGGALAASGKPSMDLIMRCVGASSTDNFPEETMVNTLAPQDRVSNRPSYWSSGGEDDPDVPESLTYRLASDICVIDEIRVRPFKAFFQIGQPIYSSRAVRIRVGHSKLPPGTETFVSDEDENQTAIADENYTWTYTSPEYPMLQEDVLQTFKLPRPALCVGGIVKIELMGRIQKQATDDRYYICVCHAEVLGRSLSPDLMIDISDSADDTSLKYLPGASNLPPEDLPSSDAKGSSDWNSLLSSYRQMRHLAMVQMLLGPVQFMDEDEAAGDYM